MLVSAVYDSDHCKRFSTSCGLDNGGLGRRWVGGVLLWIGASLADSRPEWRTLMPLCPALPYPTGCPPALPGLSFPQWAFQASKYKNHPKPDFKKEKEGGVFGALGLSKGCLSAGSCQPSSSHPACCNKQQQGHTWTFAPMGRSARAFSRSQRLAWQLAMTGIFLTEAKSQNKTPAQVACDKQANYLTVR